ncbi:sialoadhesin-like [Triplophysa dalaica]|uniref:sialoadhesin-like n=1 Tax=Triplophysa dalaica TaxID=1582913 RepID=UPI0024DFFECD|nr:sialoadhesin-like [Triplophysa dalaica]XP_056615301.1 sialoadhesin-like [Triplophysa dalaica]
MTNKSVCEILQRKIMNFRLSSLILLLHIQGSLTLDSFSVTCTKKNICAVRGAEVTWSCYYTNIKTVFWFNKKQSKNWREKNEPEDLRLDSNYSGRVKQSLYYYQSELTITDVRERDSGEYQLMFIMKDGVKHISSVTVNLTVTVLQVKMIPQSTGQQVELICDSSCELKSRSNYDWYKNGHRFNNNNNTSKNILVSSRGNADSYSCSEYGGHNPSTSVCVSNSSCWDVTYTSRRVCALVGSTVDIHSSYSHPTGYTVVNTFWHYSNFDLDLREEQQFDGRVEYEENTLRIKDVKTSDSGEYRFRIITNTSGGK